MYKIKRNHTDFDNKKTIDFLQSITSLQSSNNEDILLIDKPVCCGLNCTGLSGRSIIIFTLMVSKLNGRAPPYDGNSQHIYTFTNKNEVKHLKSN